ncbi:TIGR04104 family putative zinc finger protein [Metabacillus arenae]|uniref:Cxxc_20_cxxc protein n=1 Tax=Metabacillus arenae TaxID=2771434 RepID=A0A926RX42_9BACI|nr:TIGR04104 family putative zinc finger protein [Metabacillus arenae]MBD1380596.1 hypothetical protein [Metabacillus arenae]
MMLPECTNCKQSLNYKETFLNSFKLKPRCRKCGSRLYLTTKSRQKQSFISVITLIMWGVMTGLFPHNLIFNILFILILAILIFLITPFYTEYSNEEEPMF